MSEQPSSPESILTKIRLFGRTLSNNRAVWGYLAIGILVLLCVFQWWSAHRQIRIVRQEVAHRLQLEDAASNETQVLTKTLQEHVKELQTKVIVLESKQLEAQNKQVVLDQLYQDFSKNRDDWALAEMEQVLSTASGQLQLSGNVSGALTALQNADSRLARSDQPQFIVIRRAIARDIEKLKGLPNVDVTGLALRLDSVIAQVDVMSLLSDEKPVLSVVPPKVHRISKNSHAGQESVDWMSVIQDRWQSFFSEFWGEVRQLVRVKQVDTSDALLMSPIQGYYVRENLKLRLLNARLALLSRNESAFRSDLISVQDAITRYFDTRAKQTQTAQLLLRQIQGGPVTIEVPTLVDSLNAIRNYRTKP